MKGLGILILIVIFFWLVWPVISRWLKRKAIERAEDYMRKSMGMPPRDKSGNSRHNSERTSGGFYQQRQRKNPFGPDRYTSDEPIIPKEYAEDVEFVETKNYSETHYESTKTKTSETYHESQISDAEWVEIKSKKQ